MLDLEKLEARARRAHERGRLRVAFRVIPIVVGMALLPIALGPGSIVAAGIAGLLLVVSVALRWQSAEGARAVRAGLTLGAVPMVAGLITSATSGLCTPERSLSLCGSVCLMTVVLAGTGTSMVARRANGPTRMRYWTRVGLVASLTTALGCAGLGVSGLAAVLAALVIAAGVAWLPLRQRA
jgi:hypothetical protein